MDSQANSARKPLNSARKPLVVRQTLTSKLRAERGNQLTYYTAKLQELSEQMLSSVSKESLQSKKPQTKSVFKTPLPKSCSVKSRAKVNLTSVFKTAEQKSVNKVAEVKKSTNLADKVKEGKTPASHIAKPQKEIQKPSDKLVSNSAKVKNTTITSKYLNATARNPTVQPKPTAQNVSKSAISQNIQSAKKPSMRTDPTKKPVQYGTAQSKPKAPALKPTPAAPAPIVKPKNLTLQKKKVTVQSPLRKSLTAMHFKRTTNLNRNSTIHRTHSLAALGANQNATMHRTHSLAARATNQNAAFSSRPIRERESSETVFKTPRAANGNAAFSGAPIRERESGEMVFKTPSLARRRSVAFVTPMSSRKSGCSPFGGESVPSPVDLRRRLSAWLEKKGKPVGSYHHLRCFGLQAVTEPAAADEEDKENIEVQMPDIHSSYNDLSIETNNVDPLLVANDALFDLQHLIQEGYPRGQCEAWLEVISSRYGELEKRPQYWECRAALEEARGDFTTAVDCYQRTIMKGAEVRVVDASLDNLLQKFSVLNIAPTKASIDTKQQAKSAVEAKNVFKSSIINFAIQERTKKSEEDIDMCKFVATPVRRSTRMSRSRYSSTPGVTICPSLKKLGPAIRNSLEFKANKALH